MLARSVNCGARARNLYNGSQFPQMRRLVITPRVSLCGGPFRTVSAIGNKAVISVAGWKIVGKDCKWLREDSRRCLNKRHLMHVIDVHTRGCDAAWTAARRRDAA